MKNSIRSIMIISKYTFIEVYKSKILINIILLAIAICFVSITASEFTYGVSQKVAIDFGLGTLNLAAIAISIFMGVTLLSKEIENRTIYMILSRPVKRYVFLLGRVIGMSQILFVNVFMLGMVTVGIYMYLGGNFSQLILWSIVFIFLESVIMLTLVILLSMITNTTMAVVYSIVVYIVGHSIGDTSQISFLKESAILEVILNISKFIIPSLYKINLKDFVIYKQEIEFSYIRSIFLYSIAYIGSIISISSIIFSKKNLD